MSLSGIAAAGSTVAQGLGRVGNGVVKIASGVGDIGSGTLQVATGVVSGIEEGSDALYGGFSATGAALAGGLQVVGGLIDAVA
ncbi:hypothetical protein [Vogesella alkaliphila]|uniref:Uncharacterized protein n=1 Tax=Vogesella alkaliphila TaxID=1193621 RepID=A0ABQ2YL32_9NEIS|nr:hypothetical protein [Vogesella alkaliphila]GGX85298.1 hypothetical protein GCM10011290_11110 [Vogesella alkaliphila]